MSNIREFLKANAIPQMLEVVQYNLARKHPIHNIYEITKVQTSYDSAVDLLNLLFVKDLYQSKITNSLVKNDLINIKSFIRSLLSQYEIDFETIDSSLIHIKIGQQIIGALFKVVPTSKELKEMTTNIYGATIMLNDHE